MTSCFRKNRIFEFVRDIKLWKNISMGKDPHHKSFISYEGRSSGVTFRFESEIYHFVELSETSKSLKGFFPMGSRSRVMAFPLNFCPQIGLIIFRIFWKFQLKRIFLCWDIELLKNHRFHRQGAKSQPTWISNISTKEHSFQLKFSEYSKDD